LSREQGIDFKPIKRTEEHNTVIKLFHETNEEVL